MSTRRYPRALQFLLLLHVTASALKFNLFRNPGKDPVVREGDVRLTGSPSPWEGRVEVFHSGQWGTVCDDGWDMNAAQVVCRQLSFPAAKSAVIGKDYGQATGPIWLDDIKCAGTESSLFTCGFKSWGVTDCTHKEDVAVICESSSTNSTINSTHALDHSVSLSDEFGALFDSGDGCDLQVVVQSASGSTCEDGSLKMDTTMICAHKLILSRFPSFNVSEEVTSITVNVSQACHPHFASFIRYIYTRKVDVSFSSVQCFHWFASEFGVKQLMEDAGRLFSRILPEDISFHTQVSLYQYAVDTEDFVLQENCIQYLAWNIQNLTMSPVWPSLSADVLGALLARSDLVVPDEYFLLQAVESWILEKGSSLSMKAQADLVGRIRFPMIPAEKLYQLEVNSSLYNTHKEVYSSKVLKALKFNVLLFSSLVANPKFVRQDEDYQPRIYTAQPWSTALNPSSTPIQSNPFRSYSANRGHGSYQRYYPTPSPYGQTGSSFTTPFHNSMIFKDRTIRWDANIFMRKSDCSNRGFRCESVPAAKLTSNSQPSNIRFLNRLLLVCQGKYICEIQDFKSNMAYLANEAQPLAYPCPDDKYTYRFVIRPEYV